MLLQQSDPVWPLFRHATDPGARSYLLHRAAPLGVPAALLVDRLENEPNVTARRALILALGEFTAEQLPEGLQQRIVPRLLQWYREDKDPGIHGAVDWLLRPAREGLEPRPIDWGQTQTLAKIDRKLQSKKAPAGQRWSVNGQGQTMIALPGPVAFLMSSPLTETERFEGRELQHRRRIGRSFALASKPVTVAQFHAFLKANPVVAGQHNYPHKTSLDLDGPIIGVTWYEAAPYCRWLSEQEQIAEEDMVYPTVAEIETWKHSQTSMKMFPNYLRRKGYRLPTEAEWEYACRAETETSRYYGSSLDLLPRYAWYLKNANDRTWPVGQKKPNDFGLFDMHGNVWQWCQENSYQYQPGKNGKPTEDVEDTTGVTDGRIRVLRGGSFDSQPSIVRSVCRNYSRPSYRSNTIGLRPARTYD